MASPCSRCIIVRTIQPPTLVQLPFWALNCSLRFGGTPRVPETPNLLPRGPERTFLVSCQPKVYSAQMGSCTQYYAYNLHKTQCKIEFTYQSQNLRISNWSQKGKNGSKHPMLTISMAYNVISYKKIKGNTQKIKITDFTMEIWRSSSETKNDQKT